MRGCRAVVMRQETIESFPILAGLEPANPDVAAAWITRTKGWRWRGRLLFSRERWP
jgi:hypothetical protein